MAYATQKIKLNSQPAPQRDEYAKAVQLWNEGKDRMFEFCVEASAVVGDYTAGKTQELADRILRSATTVQNYAKVGRLWDAILKAYPSHAEIMREDLHVSHWLPVARLWAGDLVTTDGAYSWLCLCRKNKWTVEKFRTQLPTVEGKSEMAKTVKQFEFKVTGLLEDIDRFAVEPAFDVNVEVYKEFYAALKHVKELAPRVMRKEVS